MDFLELLLSKYKQDLIDLVKEEAENDDYLNMKSFKSMRQRIVAGLQPVFDDQINMFVMKAIQHYKESESHENVYEKEAEITAVQMDTQTVKMVEASTANWWENP